MTLRLLSLALLLAGCSGGSSPGTYTSRRDPYAPKPADTDAGQHGPQESPVTGGAIDEPPSEMPCLDVGKPNPDYDTSWPGDGSGPSSLSVDSVLVRVFEEASQAPDQSIGVVGRPEVFRLSDGSTIGSGAGGSHSGRMTLQDVSVDGEILRYRMKLDGPVVEHTDYDSGEQSVNFMLEAVDELVLVARRGTRQATLDTTVQVSLDAPANYVDSRFHYLSAQLCAAVPMHVDYTLEPDMGWDEDTFDSPYELSSEADIDFTAVP